MSDAHAHSAQGVAAALGVDPKSGLDAMEVVRRAAESGPNATDSEPRPGLLAMIVGAATEPFVLLLVAAGVGAILLGEARDGLLVLAALIPIVGADVVTEYRGEAALEALRAASAPIARVRRSGVVVDVPAADLVPGDVVLLRVGDVVPADVRLWRADRLLLDRSLLTGESVPEPGVVEPDADAASVADRRSVAYAGTSVVGGRGEGIVFGIGRETEVGRVARGLSTRVRRRSPLQQELDRLVRIMLVVAVALIAITTGAGFFRGNPAGENFLAGISAAIAAIPEEPPVLLAVILGLGAYRLLRRDVLVRRLNAEEVLGAVDLIITDKTGTLTRNRLEVASIRDLAGPVSDGVRRRELLEAALRAEDDAWAMGTGASPGSFTLALSRAVAEAGGTPPDPAELVDSEPVSDGRPYSTTRARRGGGVETLTLGAPESVLERALGDSHEDRSRWQAATAAVTEAGERVVALARRWDDRSWSIEALIGFADPLRDGIAEAVAETATAGIQVVVVTGDHVRTASAIARQAGLSGGTVTTGPELATMSDAEVADAIGRLSIVARATPDQKQRLVRGARAAGRIVAVTGDGVNDAPALHSADVAVAMGTGTAVAKEASDLVLGDDSFATLTYGIREGRRIVDNVQKGLVFLVSTHVALLGFLLIATIAGVGQPLLPIQILWLELFIDLSTSVAFEREPPEPDVMRRPPRPAGARLLTMGLLGRTAAAGSFSALAAFWLMLSQPGSPDEVRWLAFTSLVCAQAVRAYANRSLREPVHRLPRNGFLLAAAAVVVMVQVALPSIPSLAEAFRAFPLDATDWALVAVIAVAPAVVAEAIKSRTAGVWVA